VAGVCRTVCMYKRRTEGTGMTQVSSMSGPAWAAGSIRSRGRDRQLPVSPRRLESHSILNESVIRHGRWYPTSAGNPVHCAVFGTAKAICELPAVYDGPGSGWGRASRLDGYASGGRVASGTWRMTRRSQNRGERRHI
jgi:hypothetical protein